jgi:hypothetical protein
VLGRGRELHAAVCVSKEAAQSWSTAASNSCQRMHTAARADIAVCCSLQPLQALTDRGLNCFSSLPCLETCKLSYCPAMTASGLASFVLNCSSSIGRVEVLCCAGVRPAEAAAVQDAVWGITNRRVEVAWSRHDPVTGRDA